jgi:hypothetical protein
MTLQSTPAQLDPMKAVAKVETIGNKLSDLVDALRAEAYDVAAQWERIGDMGAQREDHAAEILGRLIPHLQEIARFSGTCLAQIARMKADPFGREGGAA